jgi:membrane associated rhomboid family serine protease
VARPRRSALDLGSAFTFGGRIPPALGLLIVLVLVATVGSWVSRNQGWAALVPALLVRGQLWRLVSWAFVQNDPLTLLFGGFMLYSLGQQLSLVWSERRLLLTFLGLAAGASVITTLAALVWPVAGTPHLGMWPVVNGLVLCWAMLYPDRQVNIWGVLPLTGKTLALLVVFGTVLYGLAGGGIDGLGAYLPHFAALALGYLLMRGPGLPTRRWKLQAREWMAEREFRKRSKHLKVVHKDGKDEPPRWMN